MRRSDESWFAQAARTPLSYLLLLAYAVLMFPGHRRDAWGDGSLHDWAVQHLAAAGFAIQDGEPWRLLTHAVVHGDFVHLACNGLALLWLGPALERALGSPRFGLLYAVTALAGAVAGVWWHGPFDVLVGGSGALFGMMGAIVALNMRAGRHLLDFLDHSGSRALLSLIVLNLVLGWVLPQVSNAAHLGGLAAGFVLTFMFLERGRALGDRLTILAQAGWIALLASTTLYTCVPTARADWLLRHLLRAEGAQARAPWAAALAAMDDRDLPHPDDLPAIQTWQPQTTTFWLQLAAWFDRPAAEPDPEHTLIPLLRYWHDR